MELKSYAKINLTLDIFPVDEQGYHELKTVFQRVSLCDTLTIEKGQNGLELSCSVPELEADAKNTVRRAYELLCETCGTELGLKVSIQKNIPMQSGLGGGSSNAGTFLRGVKELLNLDVSDEKLMEIASEVGKDVPFALSNTSTALGEKYGDLITPLPDLQQHGIIIVMGDVTISTADAYQAIDTHPIAQELQRTDTLVHCLENQRDFSVANLFHNDFELYLWETPELAAIRSKIVEVADHSIREDEIRICGSGGSMFYMFPLDQKEAWEKRAVQLQESGYWVYVGDTI